MLQLQQEKAAGWVCYLHTTKDVPDGMVCVSHKAGHIEHLFVTEKARGNGIGAKLLDFARKKLPEHEALEMCWRAIDQGASGVDMGRNIFQSSAPLAMLKAVKKVVHENWNARDAFQFWQDEKQGEAK